MVARFITMCILTDQSRCINYIFIVFRLLRKKSVHPCNKFLVTANKTDESIHIMWCKQAVLKRITLHKMFATL